MSGIDDTGFAEPLAAEEATTLPPPSPGQRPASADVNTLAVPALDLRALNAKLGFASSGIPSQATDSHAALLDEIAEDMGEVMRLLRVISAQQTELADRVKTLEETNQGQSQQIARMRRDVLEENTSAIAATSFQVVNATRETLTAMLAGLHERKDRQVRAQLGAIVSTLHTLVQSLGFREFHARKGERFDPNRMACVGYGKGEQAIVLEAVRSGYEANGKVFTPAGVIIAAPPMTMH
jgi:molecular chaperone GrpE (heat shock protein)